MQRDDNEDSRRPSMSNSYRGRGSRVASDGAVVGAPRTAFSERPANRTRHGSSNYNMGGTDDNMSGLNASQVLQASLAFEHAFIPDPQPFDCKGTSSSSLYPSMESVSQAGDSIEVEKNWRSASRSCLLNRMTNSGQGNRPPRYYAAGMAASTDTDARAGPAAGGIVRPRDSKPRSVSLDNTYTGLSNGYTRETSGSISDFRGAATSPDWESNQYATARASLPNDDGRDNELIAYAENNDDDDLLALKRAAYGGDGAISVVPTYAAGNQAEAIVVEENVHPSDITAHAVQAEFVSQDVATPVHSLASPVSTATGQYASIDEYGEVTADAGARTVMGVEEAAEATVIESGPMGKATTEAWSAAPAAEAMVLQAGDSASSILELDRKPPAVDNSQQTWVLESDQGGAQFSSFADYPVAVQENQDAEATIVELDPHPSDISADAVQAEFVGQDYHATMPYDNAYEQQIPSVEAAHVAGTTDHSDMAGEGDVTEAAEATIIGSEPMEMAYAQEWGEGPAEEAQVLAGSPESVATEVDSKPPASANAHAWVDGGDDEAARPAGMDEEAEVMGITEAVHPAELLQDEVQAELIGSDFNCAVAVEQQSTGVTPVEGVFEEASYVIEETTSIYQGPMTQTQAEPVRPQEAQATLVSEEHLTHMNADMSLAHHAEATTTLIEPDYTNVNHQGEFETATPVEVLPESDIQQPETVPLSESELKAMSGSTRYPESSHGEGQEAIAVDAGEVETTEAADDTTWTAVPSPRNENGDEPPLDQSADTVSGSQLPPSPATSTTVVDNVCNIRNGSRTDSDLAQNNGFQTISSNIARGTNNVMGMLFGNGANRRRSVGIDVNSMSTSVLPRTLLPSSVIFSEATNSWVATVNTNQRALEVNNVMESSKSLRAFSVPTKKQALALARAWAPPLMHPFASNPTCFICETQFAVFRRACHCRNCGVCICNTCTVQWPSKMLPATYNIKKESTVNICKTCDWLCSALRSALLNGDHDKAVALYSTGNINLTTPFANVKGELFYPVHCAVLGGNLHLLRWLVDEHCCPLRSIRISNGKQKDSSGSYTPILTSKGRSLLGIALANRHIGILRYLVVEKRMLLSAEKGLSTETLVQNLDLVLRVLPEETLDEQGLDHTGKKITCHGADSSGRPSSTSTLGISESTRSSSPYEHDADYSSINQERSISDDGSDSDQCIICFSNEINCVATPCGHQICCLECSKNITRCPVCAVECSFMRVFKP